MSDSAEENARLKQELHQLQQKHALELREIEAKVQKERNLGKTYNDNLMEKKTEMDQLKARMVRLTKQLDDEVSRRDQTQLENQLLERRIAEMGDRMGGSAPSMKKSQPGAGVGRGRASVQDDSGPAGAQSLASTKIMRIVDQWMRQHDMQQAMLRGSQINDMAFSTLIQVLFECPTLHTVDLSRNHLTMDSCSDVCQLITSVPNLTYLSLEGNSLSLRSIGYLMTAIMERQNAAMTPMNILDISGNEGLVQAASTPVPETLRKRVMTAGLSAEGTNIMAHLIRALWGFLHETSHPQVKGTTVDNVALHVLAPNTIEAMEAALSKILIISEDANQGGTVTADLALVSMLRQPGEGREAAEEVLAGDEYVEPESPTSPAPVVDQKVSRDQALLQEAVSGGGVHLPPIQAGRGSAVVEQKQVQKKAEKMRDPLSDLKAAFEPQKDKLKTFNLKQITIKSGMVHMTMLEKLLETTDIDARDIETSQTLLEYACNTGNAGLAKLCYRRGANLNLRTTKGETNMNIVTRNRRYDLMEFLHTYGVKVNSADLDGKTALHVAASNNDVDAVCRLVEWGAEVNSLDRRRMTALHTAAMGGHTKVTMLLLEVAADMNATDDHEFTAVAHAEANNHFALMDRLILLGGRGHGLAADNRKSGKVLGELKVSTGMLKSSSLGRLSKVAVSGMPDHISKLGIRTFVR